MTSLVERTQEQDEFEAMFQGEKTTYGIKYMGFNGHAHIMTAMGEWMSHRSVGGGAYMAKEWKTRKGAERAAAQWSVPADVFTISNNMLNY